MNPTIIVLIALGALGIYSFYPGQNQLSTPNIKTVSTTPPQKTVIDTAKSVPLSTILPPSKGIPQSIAIKTYTVPLKFNLPRFKV